MSAYIAEDAPLRQALDALAELPRKEILRLRAENARLREALRDIGVMEQTIAEIANGEGHE